MFRLAEIEQRVRKSVSERLLLYAAALPRFRGGPIANLQYIRERQQRDSDKDLEETRAPEGHSIKLKQITLAFFYEFEEQTSVNRQLKRVFGDSIFSVTHYDEIERRAVRLDAAGWSNLGWIFRKDAGHFASAGITVESMPECVNFLHLSLHQAMPSISCIEVTVSLTDKTLEHFYRIARQKYLPEVVLYQIIKGFLSPYMFGHSISGKDMAEEQVNRYICDVGYEVKSWLIGFLRLKLNQLRMCAICPMYQLERPDVEHDKSLLEYAKEHWRWLAKYGLQTHALDVYSNSQILFSPGKYGREKLGLDAMFIVDEHEGGHFSLLLDSLARGFVLESSVLGFMREARANLEDLRFKILMRLRRKKPVLSSFSQKTLALRGVLSRLRHVSAEFKESKRWIEHSLDEFGDLEVCYRDKTTKLSDNVIRYVERELTQLSDAADLVNKSISDQLEIENISAMYSLQRRMLLLTSVAAVASLIGVISVWDDLVKLWCQFRAFIA